MDHCGSFIIHVPTLVNISDIETKPLTGARTRALLSMIGMVESESNEPVGGQEYQEMMEKKDTSSKLKGLSKALMRILVAGSLDGVQGFMEDEEDKGLCYNEDFEKMIEYKDTFGLERSWTMTWWTSMCIVLAISAVITGLVLAFVLAKQYFEKKLRDEIDNLMTMDVDARCTLVSRIISVENLVERTRAHYERVDDSLRRVTSYADVLWESLVENGGCLLRERGDNISERRRAELEEIEGSNVESWRRRTANRVGTPRRMEVSENRGEEQVQDEVQVEEDDSAQYGAPLTEDEPEPFHVRTEDEMTEPEREDPLAGLNESDMIEMDLEDWARRMQIVADYHEDRLREADIREDHQAMYQIQEELDRALTLMDELPRAP